eukprot:3469986-Pleurochrysis_carterae.AAC.1
MHGGLHACGRVRGVAHWLELVRLFGALDKRVERRLERGDEGGLRARERERVLVKQARRVGGEARPRL